MFLQEVNAKKYIRFFFLIKSTIRVAHTQNDFATQQTAANFTCDAFKFGPNC